jgi:hypothetical protein
MATYILTMVFSFGMNNSSIFVDYSSLEACEKAKEIHIKSLHKAGEVRLALCTKK